MQETLIKTFGAQTWAILPSALDSISKLITGPGGEVNPQLLMPNRDETWVNYLEKRGSTAIIHINGPIFYNILYFGTNLQVATRNLQEALADRSIKQIVLHVTSPGGVITGVCEFAQLVYQARSKKKIIGYAQGMCASAAYWIFSACEVCVADPTALLGSIGVVFEFQDNTEAMENQGYKRYVVTSKQSPMKNISPADPKGEKAYQGLANDLATEFIDCVALYRGVSAETVETGFGQGFILTGERAVQAGMADSIGSMQEILNDPTSITSSKGTAMAEETQKTTTNQQEPTVQAEGQVTEAAASAEEQAAATATAKTNPDSDSAKTSNNNVSQELKTSNNSMAQHLKELQDQNKKILGMVEGIVAENKTLKEENQQLTAENEELQEKPEEGKTPKVNGMNDKVERGW